MEKWLGGVIAIAITLFSLSFLYSFFVVDGELESSAPGLETLDSGGTYPVIE